MGHWSFDQVFQHQRVIYGEQSAMCNLIYCYTYIIKACLSFLSSFHTNKYDIEGDGTFMAGQQMSQEQVI